MTLSVTSGSTDWPAFKVDNNIPVCCRSDGHYNSSISLPSLVPFYLIRVSGKCLWWVLDLFFFEPDSIVTICIWILLAPSMFSQVFIWCISQSKTAHLKIHNDILASVDAGKVTALTLLALSAAFDTIDSIILLKILDEWFGVRGKALDWLKRKCQRTKLGDCLSSKANVKFGVPLGSVLGPLLFTLYTIPLSSMI